MRRGRGTGHTGPMTGPTPVPDPTRLHPSSRPELTNVVLLRAQVTSELIEVGEFTYHDDEGSGVPFESGNVHYLYGPQRLIIGRFTAIGPGVEILMPGGNHPMVGPSTYPFTMFGGQWTERTMDTFRSIEPLPDTRIGNDVWLGRQATVLPGVRIGDGAVVGARAVVTKDVAPYAVVAGNPARHVRTRFSPDDVTTLLRARWWDWPVWAITDHAATIMGGSVAEISHLAERLGE